MRGMDVESHQPSASLEVSDGETVNALKDWLDASDSRFGPVFRKVDRLGNVEHRRLGTDAIRRIVVRRARVRLRREAPA